MSKSEANEQALSGNDVQPVATVTADLDSYAASTLNSNSTASTKVLGIPWNRESDMFELELNAVFANATTGPVTKREVLAISSRFYDLLGLLAPAVITLKIFFLELCSQKLAWDDTLTGDLANRWAKIVSDMQNAPVVSVPRCYLTGSEGKITSVSLHGFCDASCKAFAAVVYLVLSNGSQNFVQLAASTCGTSCKANDSPTGASLGLDSCSINDCSDECSVSQCVNRQSPLLDRFSSGSLLDCWSQP